MTRHAYTADELTAMHKALHRACNMPQLRPIDTDLEAWKAVVAVMRPLEETDEGRFTLADLVDVLAEMNRVNANRDAKFRFTMRPTAILRDPERLRDLVLECREKKRRRQRPAPVVKSKRMAEHTQAVEIDEAADRDAVSLTDLVHAERARLTK